MDGMKRLYFPVVKGQTIGNIASATVSTNDLDRQGEIIEPDGISLTNYLTNPVVLYGHAYQGIDSIPVGRAVSMEIYHEGDKKSLKADWEWQADDVTPLISAIKKSWERGFLNTVSIGFMENEREDNTITKMDMLEFSIVPIPANPMALRLNGFTDAEVKALIPDVTPADLIVDLERLYGTKEGRVLSAKNYGLVKDCVDSLNALLKASDMSASGDAQPEPDDWLTALHKALMKT